MEKEIKTSFFILRILGDFPLSSPYFSSAHYLDRGLS